MATCIYCKYFAESKTVGRPDDSGLQQKKCIAKKRKVNMNSEQCLYFSPANDFHCDNYGYRLKIPNCLNRRFNSSNFTKWEKCNKCRQFQNDLSQVITD